MSLITIDQGFNIFIRLSRFRRFFKFFEGEVRLVFVAKITCTVKMYFGIQELYRVL